MMSAREADLEGLIIDGHYTTKPPMMAEEKTRRARGSIAGSPARTPSDEHFPWLVTFQLLLLQTSCRKNVL